MTTTLPRRPKTRKQRQVNDRQRRRRQRQLQGEIAAALGQIVRASIEAALQGEVTLLLGRPKNARRDRTDPTVVRARCNKCGEERLLAGSRWQDTGYVFASRVGKPTEPQHLKTDFDSKIERLGLPWIRVHDLRHTCATLLLARDVHPKVVQEMLGHSTISLTLDTYSHVLPTMQEEAARVMERVLASV